MKLEGRDLREGLKGNDVASLQADLKLLGYNLRAEERTTSFGPLTKAAVIDFQRRNGLPANGVVTPINARRINTAIDRLPGRSYQVDGSVRHQDGTLLPDLIVSAFERSHDNDRKLGESTTDKGGRYSLSFTPEPNRPAGLHGPSIILRVFGTSGITIAESETIFHPQPVQTIDIVVIPATVRTLSEFEALVGQLAFNRRPDKLTPPGIALLAGESGVALAEVENYARAARFAKAAVMPHEVAWSLVREGIISFEQLEQAPPERFGAIVREAVKKKQISQLALRAIPGIERKLKRLHENNQPKTPGVAFVEHRVVVQLVRKSNGEPLSNVTVEAFALQLTSKSPLSLGQARTNADGFFALPFPLPVSSIATSTIKDDHRFRLIVSDAAQKQTVETGLRLDDPAQEAVEVLFENIREDEITLSEVSQLAGFSIPRTLAKFLETKDIKTLADVRTNGGIADLKGLPLQKDDPAVLAIDGHAQLDTVSADRVLNQSAINLGYGSIGKIATASRAEFVSATADRRGEYLAAEMHSTAKTIEAFAQNKAVWGMAHEDEWRATPGGRVQEGPCGCEDCEAAVSPLAYLADLLRYAKDHVRRNNGSLSLSALETMLGQPFGQLPVSCRLMDQKVRQVRIAIEVLRVWHEHHPPSASARVKLQKEERKYRWTAYTGLLARLGTSFEEVRLARTAPADRRKAIADRLGLHLGPSPDMLARLYLEPDTEGEPGFISAIPETSLSQRFGLRRTTGDPLAAVSASSLQLSKLAFLRDQWRATDWPAEEQVPNEPIIDPDIVGPDDFRKPFQNAAGPFSLWVNRRQWVDARLAEFRSMRSELSDGTDGAIFATLIARMYQPLTHPVVSISAWNSNTPESELDNLWKITSSGDDTTDAVRLIGTDLRLTLEAFGELMRLRRKAMLASADPAGPTLEEAEWEDVFSILVQSTKVAVFDQWRTEEDAANFTLDPRMFWRSLRSSVEGIWPPLSTALVLPLVDPQLLDKRDLPETTAGQTALGLRAAREVQLSVRLDELHEIRLMQGFEAALTEALITPGDPPLPDPVTRLALLSTARSTTDTIAAEQAADQIQQIFKLTVEQFEQLMIAQVKSADAASQNHPSEAEWNEAEGLLVTAWKGKVAAPQWTTEEAAAGLTPQSYWLVRKANLPKWRATAERRGLWRRALDLHSQPGLIDPDLLSYEDFKDPAPADDAFELYREREQWIAGRLNTLAAAPESLVGLEGTASLILGVPFSSLLATYEEATLGEDVEGRLGQLNLSWAAFQRLIELRASLSNNGQPGGQLLSSEWNELRSILVSVEKHRRRATWRKQEKEAGLLLGPDFFVLPQKKPAQFQLPKLPELPKWRASIAQRFDWQDTLSSRISQEDAVLRSLEDLVSSTESTALPVLRDALLQHADLPGTTQFKTERLEELLFIELRDSGCAVTTRVSAAIATIQSLLFALRTAQSKEAHPELSLDADDFDEEWTWMGEYAWWRAALFTFLYPENLLLPQLSKVQTPALEKLITDLRSNRRLTPAQACEAGNRYQTYFADVGKMQLAASCVTRATIYKSGTCGEETTEHCLTFYFGIGYISDNVYWSFYDPHAATSYAHSFWYLVDGLANVRSIVGAVPSVTPDRKRFIFLFLTVMEEGERRLAFTRYDLENRVWDGSIETLDSPFDATEFEAVVYQRDHEDYAPIICLRLLNGPMKNAVVMRRLNAAHSDWSENDWTVLAGKQQGHSIKKLLALVKGDDCKLLIVLNDEDSMVYRNVDGDDEDGMFYDVDTKRYPGSTFIGAFRWPGKAESYAFWRRDGVVYFSVLAASTNTYTISDLYDYNAWLESNAGASIWFTEYDFGGHTYEIFTGVHYHDAGFTADEMRGFFPGDWDIDVDNPDALFRLKVHLPSTSNLGDFLIILERFLRGLKDINQIHPADKRDYWWGYSEDAAADVNDYLNDVCDLLDELRDSGSGPSDWEYAESLSKIVFDKSVCGMIKKLTREEQTFTAHSTSASAPRLVPQQDILRIATACNVYYEGGDKTTGGMRLGVRTTTGPQRAHWQNRDTFLNEISEPRRLAPDFATPDKILSPGRPFVRALAIQAWNRAQQWPASEFAYLREAWYLVPVHIALQLQRASQYTAALDWFRVVYNYGLPETFRAKSPLLFKDIPGASNFERSDEWLLDPLNPHGIALTRPGSYTRFTIQSIAQCFLEFGDAEFTRDTAESVPRARLLYDSALDLLKSRKLKPTVSNCNDIIGSLDVDVPDSWNFGLSQLQNSMRRLNNSAQLSKLVDDVKTSLAGPGDWPARFAEARTLISNELGNDPPRSMEEVISPASVRNVRLETTALSGTQIKTIAGSSARNFRLAVAAVSGISDTELVRGASLPWLAQRSSLDQDEDVSPAIMARALTTGSTAQFQGLSYDPVDPGRLAQRAAFARVRPEIGLKAALQFTPSYKPRLNFSFCIPVNPLIEALVQKAETELFKIRNCRNIAGLERQLDPYAAPTDTITGLPSIGGDGQIVLPGLARFPPTAYRFRTLIDRAKQLVTHAQQLEAALLSALEKFDAESFHLLQARQQVQLTRAGVRLQQLRTQEAEDGVRLAELQQERAQLHVEHFEDLLSTGMTALERQSIAMLQSAAGMHNASAVMSFIAAAFQASAAAASSPTDVSQALALTAGSFSSTGSGLSSMAAAMSTNSAILSMYASHERQMQEWEFQRTVAGQDVRIGAQNVKLSEDRLRVVGQEYAIAQLQVDQAESTVEFLAKKFTNVELYDWMSKVLEGVFSYFLQQATATAQVAAAQLAFERQENAPPYISGDYWSPPSETGMSSPAASSQAPDRRGLTGSARLLEDIYRLDQYAFDTDQRKLQLSKPFSLAHLAPIEFQRFRETGVMVFRTPLELFDREFPGHYLRLIHSVRTSVIALIPPNAGIAATLTAAGVSRVVVGGTIFQNVSVNHGPRSVSLSSPRDATGMFTLDPQPELLKPFEGMGVDALWELRMPRAANLFDYRSIADVLITIDYTALNSYNYYQQVIQTLEPTLSASRPFSFRHQFADQWYDLHNPDQTASPMIVRFKTAREDFPGNLDHLKISQVALYFARAQGELFEVSVNSLRFTEQLHGENLGGGSVGGGSTSIDGLISTLKGNAGSWTSMMGKTPVGEWELVLPNTVEMRNRFKEQEIEDMLLVITYTGRTPEWPT